MSETRFDTAVVVLGAHRSGTSALTGVLRLCGLTVPATLRPQTEAGPSGSWESELIASLNDEILAQNGLNWLSLEAIPSHIVAGRTSSAGMVQQQKAALDGEFPEATIPLIEDARLCRLLPIWQAALSSFALRTVYLVVFRNPLENAQALGHQENLHLDEALQLWVRHYLDAEAATRGQPRAFVAYRDLLADWRGVLVRLSDALSMTIGSDALNAGAIDLFLLDQQRHNAIPDDVAVDVNEINPVLVDTFRIFSDWARGASESETDHQYLDEARAQLDRLGSNFPCRVGKGRVEQTPQSVVGHSGDQGSQSRSVAPEPQVEEVNTLLRLHMGTIQVREDKILSLSNELEAASEELKRLKRKYRSTQTILTRERQALNECRAKLAQAEATLSRYRDSFMWQLHVRITAWLASLRTLGLRVIGNSEPKRQERMVALLEQSSLFDREWYLETYPDVAASGTDPVQHYLDNGWREGRDPGPGFSTTAYLKVHADVAAHGLNPLLHYVEYGHSEGRGAPEHAAPKTKNLPRQDFGPAAPCASFALPPASAPHWRRAGRFGQVPGMYTLAGGLVVGALEDEARASALRAAIDRLASLSGGSEGVAAAVSDDDQSPCAVLLDAWYAERNRLRSRWRRSGGDAPMVVRILQHVDGALEMIGEALLTCGLDVVDAKLINQYFPLLFVFADVEGRVLGWRMLAFPSWCRGGLHHAEFAALNHGEGPAIGDVCVAAQRVANRLLAIRAGSERALIRKVKVDLRGADGTHTLFQPNFQQWLAAVAQVPMAALEAAGEGGPAEYLREAVQVTCEPSRSSGAGTLILGSDMVPSLAALAARVGEANGTTTNILAPMILSGEAMAQPSLVAHMPEIVPDGRPSEHAPAFPILSLDSGGDRVDGVPAFAVRTAATRPRSDAELLVPASPSTPDTASNVTPITWLIWPAAWAEGDLFQSLEAVALQSESGPASILFVGSPSDDAAALAAKLFGRRVAAVEDSGLAAAAITTPLVGVVGPSVIMHDQRTARVLAELLEDPQNISASVALVSIERRGKDFLVSPIDEAIVHASGQHAPGDHLATSASLVWRSLWPAAAPSRDLWLARADYVSRCLNREQVEPEQGIHACSAVVTASYCGQPRFGPEDIRLPPAGEDRALWVEVVV